MRRFDRTTQAAPVATGNKDMYASLSSVTPKGIPKAARSPLVAAASYSPDNHQVPRSLWRKLPLTRREKCCPAEAVLLLRIVSVAVWTKG